MKKLGIVVVAVTLLGALALPPVFGMFTEDQARARVAELSEGDVVDAEMRDFRRGWFTSTAHVDLALTPQALARVDAMRAGSADDLAQAALEALARLADRALTVEVHFSHGPLMLDGRPRGGLSRVVARLDSATEGLDALLEMLGIPYVFEFRGHTNFGGVLYFDADIPPIEHSAGDTRLSFSGLLLDGSLRGQRLIAEARTDALRAAAGPWRLDVEGFSASADNVLLPQGLVLGSLNAGLDRIALSNGADSAAPLFEALGPSFKGSLQLNDSGTLVDAELSQSVARLSAGEEVRLDDAALALSARNLDLQAVQAYAIARRLSDPQAPVEPLLAGLLSASPALSIDPLRFELNGESFEARLTAEVEGAAVPPPAAMERLDRSLWTELVTGEASIRLSKALAEDLAIEVGKLQLRGSGELTEEEIEATVASNVALVLLILSTQGFVHEIGDDYAAEISYANGMLRLNERQLPLGLMMR